MNAMTSEDPAGHRLTAEMASFRVLVKACVTDYMQANGESPSYGEIAARLHSNRERVRKAVKRLVRDGELVRVPGPRGLRLPGLVDAAVRLLRERGWSVDEDIQEAGPVTKRPLLPPAELRYPKRGSEQRDGDGQQAA